MNQKNIVYDDEIDLREYIAVVQKNWQQIAYCAIGLAILALVFSLLQKPVFEAKTTVYLKSSGAASQYASLASLAGINLSGGGSNLSDLSELLNSKAVARKVFYEMNLKQRIKGWDKTDLEDERLINSVPGMLKKPKITGGFMEITAQTNDAKLSADLANAYAKALAEFWSQLNMTEAQKKKSYIDSQMPKIEKDLAAAEANLKQLTLMASGANLGLNAKSVEMQRIAREVEIQNTVYIMLRKEYETAKLDAAKDMPPFSVIDQAQVPLHKSKPKVKLNVMIGFVLGGFIGIFIAFFREYWEKSSGKQ